MTDRSFPGVLFVLPLLLGVLLFQALPALASVLLSLCSWSLSAPPRWVGLANYRSLLGFPGGTPDPLFLQALFNTFIICLAVPLQVCGSFALACFLSGQSAWRRSLRLVVFLPTLVSPVALFILWRAILQTDVGLLARCLDLAGLCAPLWLEDPAWSKPAVMMVLLWQGVGGFQMLFFLAGLRQIPQQLHEMARLDGLGLRHKLTAVYWPWLRPLFLFNLCLGLLSAVQGGFEIAYVMTGGGPLRSTTTLAYYLFENAFQWQRMGYGTAIGVTMFLIVTPLLVIRGKAREGKRLRRP